MIRSDPNAPFLLRSCMPAARWGLVVVVIDGPLSSFIIRLCVAVETWAGHSSFLHNTEARAQERAECEFQRTFLTASGGEIRVL